MLPCELGKLVPADDLVPLRLLLPLAALVLLGLSGADSSRAAAGRATDDGLLLYGGPIYTGVAGAPKAEAVLTRHGRIIFVGSLAGATKQAGALVHG